MFDNNNIINFEYILNKIKNNKFDEILKNICYIENNNVIIDYIYIKYFANITTYDLILQYIINNIDNILKYNDKFGVHVNVKMLTLLDIDKHRNFISHMCAIFKDKYPNKLEQCYIYNASNVFSHLYSIISLFIDKVTKEKIIIINKK
jgi:hypothetical protein